MAGSAKYTQAWVEFIAAIEKGKADLNFEDNEECFYRGHPNSDWQLCPSLLRGITPYNKNLITRERWHVECDLYYEFRSRARVLHNKEMTDWDVLFTMQHHSVPTRLLDWTEMLGVAIYFALLGCESSITSEGYKPCIWLLNPYRLNELYHHGDRDLWAPENLEFYGEKKHTYSDYLRGIFEEEKGKMFHWEKPVALYPLRKNDRLTTQGGYFTIHGNNVLPLESLQHHGDFLRKVELPRIAMDEAFNFLQHAGINHFTMFPDLDGLANYLKQKYF